MFTRVLDLNAVEVDGVTFPTIMNALLYTLTVVPDAPSFSKLTPIGAKSYYGLFSKSKVKQLSMSDFYGVVVGILRSVDGQLDLQDISRNISPYAPSSAAFDIRISKYINRRNGQLKKDKS